LKTPCKSETLFHRTLELCRQRKKRTRVHVSDRQKTRPGRWCTSRRGSRGRWCRGIGRETSVHQRSWKSEEANDWLNRLETNPGWNFYFFWEFWELVIAHWSVQEWKELEKEKWKKRNLVATNRRSKSSCGVAAPRQLFPSESRKKQLRKLVGWGVHPHEQW